ncbi:MAG: DNA polymerase III subunit beta [Acidimicrobiia bacterium]
MRIRAERDDLADVFSRANRGVGVRPAQAILQGVLCEVQGKTLKVTGTDLELTVRTTTEVEVLEEGSMVIPARLATEAIKKMPAGAVTISSGEGEVEIIGAGPRFSLRELPVDEFPHLGDVDFQGAVDADGDELVAAIAQATVGASIDSARPILTGVLFEKDDQGVRLVATDSYRLAVRKLPGVTLKESGLVPARGLREMSRTVGAAKMKFSIQQREAVFGSARGSLTLRLIEGTFPNYRQLLPESYPNRVVVTKEGLLEALGRASLVAEDHIPVRLRLMEGGVEVTVTRQDVGGETEHIPGEYQGEVEDVTIAFNPRYLTDGVSAIDSDEVQIEVTDGLKPSVIRGVDDDRFTYLLMPVRI